MIAQIDHIIKTTLKDSPTGAAVAVIKNGEPLAVKGYGAANLEWDIPVSGDTVFLIGNLTMTFTAVGILKLAEDGKLDLQAPISYYLPEFPTSGHVVKLEDLLNHASGIQCYSLLPNWRSTAHVDMSTHQMMGAFAPHPFLFRPGSKNRYCDSNYFLLGMVIEKVTGTAYHTYMEKQFFAPLGMHHTGPFNPQIITPCRASGYNLTPKGLKNAPYFSYSQMYAATGLGSSINDLVIWDRALWQHQLLKPESMAALSIPRTMPDGNPAAYGYAWIATSYSEHPVICDTGIEFGFRSFFARFPEDDLSIILLSNLEETNVRGATLDIARQVLDLPVIHRRPFMPNRESIRRCLGSYDIDGATVTMKLTPDNQIELTAGRSLRLMPMSAHSFYDADDPDVTVSFAAEIDGVYTQIRISAPLVPSYIGYRVKPTKAGRTLKSVARDDVLPLIHVM
ncbi:MAG: beta-lactamase family protein [Anaerolineae bacterium]|nr:beta-lactamase family protein [Anaerolineae bacterium]